MKKTVVMFSVLIITLLCSISVFAAETDDSGMWEYQTYGTGVELKAYKGTQADVYVPGKIIKEDTEYSVLKLGDELFKGNTTLNSATLGEGITEIGASAFEGATNLVCIVTPESLTTIGANAFSDCTNFNSIILYDGVTSIGENAFSNSDKLTVYCNEGKPAHVYVSGNNITYEILNSKAEPEYVTLDGIEYYILNGEAIAVSFDNISTTVTIPSTIQNYPVTNIKNIFEKSNIETVTLPNTIKKLEESAFSGCKKLTKINIPDSITSMGTRVFSDCTSLTSFVIPNGIKTIPMEMFSGCTSLKSVTMPNSVTKIYQYAFSGCWNLSEITIPENVTEIWHSAFQWCTRLTKIYWNAINIDDFDSDDDVFYDAGSSVSGIDVVFGDKVERIPAHAFSSSRTPNIKSVTFDRNVTSIGLFAFPSGILIQDIYIKDLENWCNITFDNLYANPAARAENIFIDGNIVFELVIPDGITKLNRYTFYNWDSLRKVTLPEKLVSIGEEAFSDCSLLENISIPGTVTSIGSNAFSGCFSLENITIPDTVTSIGSNAFSHCKSLTEVTLPNTVDSLGSGIFTNCTGIKKVTLPDNITVIPSAMFSECTGLTNITIPNTVTQIGPYAFRGCLFMDITLPDSLVFLGNGAFYNCTKLIDITIPDSVTQINDSAFYNCYSLENITIPDTVTTIGSNAFYGCTKLDCVIIPKKVTVLSPTSFPASTILGVYENSYAHTFAIDNNLLYYVTTENIKPTITTIDGITYLITGTEAIAMRFDNSITEVVVPAYVNNYPVTDIRTIFARSDITSISIPETISTLNSKAFYNCKNLSCVSLPNSITHIGTYAFYNCTSLNDINIPNTVSEIADNTFYNCSALKAITIPTSVTSIGNSSFYGCANIEYIIIPENITSMLTTSFPVSTILGVYENSYAHTFAIDNNLLYYVTTENIKPTITTLDGITYLITGTEAIAMRFDNSITEVVVPAYVNNYPVTNIRTAFRESSITSIVLPNTISEIPKTAFDQCKNLERVILPDIITSIGDYAFRNCSSLESITIPETVTHIGSYAFEYCRALESITIPKNVTYLGNKAFDECSNMKEIIWKAVNVYDCSSHIFTYAGTISNSIKVTVAPGVKSLPAKVFSGSGSSQSAPRTTSISIPASLRSIGEDAFLFNRYLTDLHIESIEAWCAISFENFNSNPIGYASNIYIDNEKVSQITIPSTVNAISKYAFYDISSLEITISEGVRSIGAQAFYNANIKNITIPKSVTTIGPSAFSNSYLESVSIMGSPILQQLYDSGGVFSFCSKLKTVNIFGDISIVDYTFRYCPNITNVNIYGNIRSVELYAFADSNKIKTLRMPASVTSMSKSAFPISTILVVDENSYAHNFAVKNNLLYFVLHKTKNPEISYGSSLSGTATYTNGTAVSNATVEILYDDGTVKESVVTDANGDYEFTYAEVGQYTIRVTDIDGNTASEIVSIKRMNVFDVYLAGETNLVLKKGYNVSGTVSPSTATIILADTNGNVISTLETTNGIFDFTNIPKGSYILKAENDTGSSTTEIYVSNDNVTGITLEIKLQSATITGDTKIENRDGTYSAKIWVSIDLIDAGGNVVAHTVTDENGRYIFSKVPAGSYNIVAKANEMRPDIIGRFDKSHELKGYGHIDVTEYITYTVDTIILREDKVNLTSVSGKVTANGTTQDCEVILTNENGDQIAVFITDKNGKYNFVNIPDGMYCITAITKNDGMGFSVITIENGVVHGDTDIKVAKADKISKREETLFEIPDCNTKQEALLYKEAVLTEKAFYDSLSEKERKQLSEEWIKKLFKLVDLISGSSINAPEGVTVENEESILSPDEIENEGMVEFVLSITQTQGVEVDEDGITSEEEYETEKIKDKKGKDKRIAKYYDITFSKDGQKISNIQKQTETNGKLRITMDIPKEHRGHKHYSFIHMHNGEAITLVDLDDDPNTVTFEIDKFSTFALAYSDIDLLGEVTQTTYPATITYDENDGKISVLSTENGKLYIATYNGESLSSVVSYDVVANAANDYDFNSNQAAFVWNENLKPMCEKFVIGN